jgi:hypothetical protein
MEPLRRTGSRRDDIDVRLADRRRHDPLSSPDRMLALQRTIGNAATARLLSARGRVLHRQRDLEKGATVEFTAEGVTKWGAVEFLDDQTAPLKFVVEEDGKPGKKQTLMPLKLTPVNQGEKLDVGTKVKAAPFKNEEYLGTITEKVGGTSEQFYDIKVEWEEGWQVPKPYVEPGVREPDVRAKSRSEFQPRALKTGNSRQMEHFHPEKQLVPNAAEYVKPGGPIDITSHALGSGMYGVAEATPEIVDAATQLGPFRRVLVQITDPLIVQNALHGQELQTLNKRINQIAQGIEKGKKYGKEDIEAVVSKQDEELKDLLLRVFGRAGMEVPELAKVNQALARFFQRYQAPDSKFVDQPATIFLAELCGLGGIWGDRESGLNSYQKGSVKFVPPTQNESRKTRSGTAHEFVT